MLGLFHILLGNMPAKYKGVLKTFGFVPDMQLGLYELKKAVNEPHIFQQESMMLICIIEHFILKSDENISKLEALVKKEPNDLLASYLYTSLLSKSSKGYLAYNLIQNLKQPPGALPFPYLHYLKGTLFLQKGEYGQAQVELKSFIKEFHGENYRKDTYYKLSLASNLKGDSLLAKKYMDTVRLTGKAQVECDKHAESVASKNSLGNKDIIHAMLLFDGGYLKEAKKILDEITVNNLNTPYQLELLYRKGRVYHELKLETEAIALYKQVIMLQQEEKYYFAPNACLQLGYIYLKQDQEMAKLYFNKAMSYSGHEYENSINTKSKAAINKLNKQ
jgi:tetratricopeptide (TPR) repeat protein